MENAPQYWGLSSCIDLYECDLGLMKDEDAIREFVKQLCDRIKMKRYGETQVVHFGEDPRGQRFQHDATDRDFAHLRTFCRS